MPTLDNATTADGRDAAKRERAEAFNLATNPRTIVDEYVAGEHRYVTYADGDSFAYPVDAETITHAYATDAQCAWDATDA